MANNNIAKCTLVLSTIIGVDDKNKDIIKTQKFERVKPSTTANDLLVVGNVLGSLLVSTNGQPTIGKETQGNILG